MKEIPADTMRSMQLEMLKYIDEICTSNNLRYYAAYGTLLGTIRHNGFIPWDDDIDLYMPRSEYEKFSELLQNDSAYYKTISIEENEDYFHPFAKVYDSKTTIIENGIPTKYDMGVYIDIFIIDGLPDNQRTAIKHYKKCHRLMVLLYCIANNVFPKDNQGKTKFKSIHTSMDKRWHS